MRSRDVSCSRNMRHGRCRRFRSHRGSGNRRRLHRRLCRLLYFHGDGRFWLRGALQLAANLFRDVNWDGTGVSLLLGYAKTRQKVNDCFRFDLELSGQFINSDLGCVTHASLRTFLFLLTLGSFFLR